MTNLKRGRMKETDVTKGNDCPIPSEPGIYRHINKNTREVEYAGYSTDLRRRQQEHERTGKLDTSKQTIAYSTNPQMNKDDLRRVEKEHIARKQPTGNKTRGGNGR